MEGFEKIGITNLPTFNVGSYPQNFKALEFKKYDRIRCLKLQARLNVRKMERYVQNEQLMVLTFQDSLTGLALTWYAQLDLNEINTWEKLARAFYNQYKFNIEEAPSIWHLSNLQKKSNESFKEYAQKGRALAARVAIPLLKKQLTSSFINTLEEPFFSHLIGHTLANFSGPAAAWR